MVSTRSLQELADSNFCDKGLVGPSSRWSANNYVDVYEAYFSTLRERPLRVLEIGIGVRGDRWQANIAHGRNAEGGASLKTWAAYFPNARIYGLDINDARHLETDRVSTFIVDQGSRAELRAFLEKCPDKEFDIIVDDGSHRADHQQVSLEVLFPALAPGGFYVVEDLNDRGFQERSGGKHAATDVVSTRTLLMGLKRDGKVAQPNAFEDAGVLDQVEFINFHCPRPRLRLRDLAIETARTLTGRGGRGVIRTEYVPDSFKIAVLKKTSAGRT